MINDGNDRHDDRAKKSPSSKGGPPLRNRVIVSEKSGAFIQSVARDV